MLEFAQLRQVTVRPITLRLILLHEAQRRREGRVIFPPAIGQAPHPVEEQPAVSASEGVGTSGSWPSLRTRPRLP